MKLRRPFKGNFTLSQGFGGNAAAYAKFGLKGHNGLDYALPVGTPLLAAHAGTVTEVALDGGGTGQSGYGAYIKIELAGVCGTLYAHMSRWDVKLGDVVKEGQQIGLSGGKPGAWGAGNTTGAHLHWGYFGYPRNRQNGYSGYVDQAGMLITRAEQEALPSGITNVSGTNSGSSSGGKEGTVEISSTDFENLVRKSTLADKWQTKFKERGVSGDLNDNFVDQSIELFDKTKSEKETCNTDKGKLEKKVTELEKRPESCPECPTGGGEVAGIPEEIEVNGKPWGLNGINIDETGKKSGNYARKQ